jgi:hypothetical protein
MKAYRIIDWDKYYEVTKDGKPATDKSKNIRKASLSYVRLPVQGHNPSMSYREMLQKAGDKGMMVFGVFCKLLELAANHPRERRGWLLDTKGLPLVPQRIAFALCCDRSDIDFALQVLTDKDIGWVSEMQFPSEQTESTTEDKKDCPVIINETEENITKQNETKETTSTVSPEKSIDDINLEKISRNLRSRPKHQIGNLGRALNNVLSDMHPVREFRSLTNETSRSIPPKQGAFSNGADSKNSSSSASTSDQWDWQKAKERWSLTMQKYFPQSRFIRSDATTFVEMIKYLYEKRGPLTDELFNKAIDFAAQAKSKPGVKNPVAYFVSRFKSHFGDFTKATS